MSAPSLPPPFAVDWKRFQAVLFDLDGVLTPTAEVHEQAWKTMFDEFLSATAPDQDPFDAGDYLRFVDGKPRFDGVRSFLASRGIELPNGDPTDAPGMDTVGALGNRKNELFGEVLRRDGMSAYPGSLAVMELLEQAGIAMAVVSSSRNAPGVLRAARLDHRFDIVIDGNVAADIGLTGKPSPDMFLEAARRLGVEPGDAIVVEDAVSGVAAGHAGSFGVVLGVDRGGNRQALLDHGADLVVNDLAETLDESRTGPHTGGSET